MRMLLILNDPPYGTERTYNALRLAHALLKKDPRLELTGFLKADAVVAAKAGQRTPDGYYNDQRKNFGNGQDLSFGFFKGAAQTSLNHLDLRNCANAFNVASET